MIGRTMDIRIAEGRSAVRVSPISAAARDWLNNNWCSSDMRNSVLEVSPRLAMSMMLAALSAGFVLEFIENGDH
jgi:hypothetical protein